MHTVVLERGEFPGAKNISGGVCTATTWPESCPISLSEDAPLSGI
ncbi:MAG: hypothetical protein ACLFPB_04160 [Desulfovermiculus sp.]